MRHHGLVEGGGHVIDALNFARSSRIKNIGLQDVWIPKIDQLLEPPPKRILLPRRYSDIQRIGHLPQAR